MTSSMAGACEEHGCQWPDGLGQMIAEHKAMREALEWYADPATYDHIGPGGQVKGTAWKLREDMGARARAALRLGRAGTGGEG